MKNILAQKLNPYSSTAVQSYAADHLIKTKKAQTFSTFPFSGTIILTQRANKKGMMNRTWIIISLMLGTFMATLDSSIVDVSLPVMQQHFKVALDDM